MTVWLQKAKAGECARMLEMRWRRREDSVIFLPTEPPIETVIGLNANCTECQNSRQDMGKKRLGVQSGEEEDRSWDAQHVKVCIAEATQNINGARS